MIVCSCLGITDGEIREAMRGNGAFAAGSCCGSCMPLVSDIVRKLKEDDANRRERESAAPAPEPQQR